MDANRAAIAQTEAPPTVLPTSAACGAIIRNVQLSGTMTRDQEAFIKENFHEHQVLVFPGQALEKQDLIAFTRIWGSIGEHVLTGWTRDGLDEIHVISNLGPDGKPIGKHPDIVSLRWHTDKSYMPRPALATILYGVEVPSEGGDTLFADMYGAYEALPEDTKGRIADLIGIHSLEYSRRFGTKPATEEEIRRAPPVAHPLVKVHPVTGRKALYCGHHAWRIEGWAEEESRELLDMLYDHATRPEFVYRHKWSVGDVVIWDNRCVLHAATPFDTAAEKRVMLRTVTMV